MEIILAIDGGGSRTRCLAIDRAGQVVSQAEGGPSNHLLIAGEIVKRSLSEVIHRTLQSGSLKSEDVVCVSAGLAGVDFDGTGAPLMERLLRELGPDRVVVNGDMVIAHAGALGLDAGVVALSGTGSAILGVDAQGRRVKVGGWGPIYGDEGSAYRIGQMSLRAAARAFDGSGPETLLTAEMKKALGLEDFRQSLARVYLEAMQPRDIAALSQVAYKIAEAGDEVARNIFLRSADELAAGVAAAIRQLKLHDSNLLVSYQGAVLDSCLLLRERFVETLKDHWPTCNVIAPRHEPVMGAYLLGRKTMGWEEMN